MKVTTDPQHSLDQEHLKFRKKHGIFIHVHHYHVVKK